VPEAFDGFVEAVFTDEPSLMTSYLKDAQGLLPAVPWSRTFRREFREATGADVLPLLPALFHDCGPETPYHRAAYWRFVTELVEKHFFQQLEDWCRAHNTVLTGHALYEERLTHHVAFEGSLYACARWAGRASTS
jgi:hypothetical protein